MLTGLSFRARKSEPKRTRMVVTALVLEFLRWSFARFMDQIFQGTQESNGERWGGWIEMTVFFGVK